MDFGTIWAWLKNTENRATISWLGGALIAVISTCWGGYQYLQDEPKPAIPVVQQPIAPTATQNKNDNDNDQQVNVGNIGGNATVNINQDQR